MIHEFFVCGADITFDSKGVAYVCGYAGEGLTEADAVKACASLHPAHGYAIYRVSLKTRKGLNRSFGLRAGNPCSGHRVLERMRPAYEHPDWPLYRNQTRLIKD